MYYFVLEIIFLGLKGRKQSNQCKKNLRKGVFGISIAEKFDVHFFIKRNYL